MATLDSDLFVAAQNSVVALAVRDLRAFWARLDHTDPVAVRVALETSWPLLIERYGEVAVTLAADRFEEITGLSAVLVRAVDPERANARMRWAMFHAFEGDAAGSLALLEGLADELSKQPGRSTMIASAAEHGLKFARVAVGDTCPWCRMLAGRGFAYRSRENAGDMRAFHPECDCYVIVEGESPNRF